MPNYRVQNGQLTRENRDTFEVAAGVLSVKPAGTNERGSWSGQVRLKARTGVERLVGYSGDLFCSLVAEDGSKWAGKAAVGKIFPETHEVELKGSGPLAPLK